MWCQHCQQDVPAIAHSVGGEVVCVRCQRGFETPPSLRMFEFDSSDDSENGADNTSQDPVENLTDWRTDCKFRHLALKQRWHPTPIDTSLVDSPSPVFFVIILE